MALFDFIEVFYNQRRRHSTLGQVSPAEFERTDDDFASLTKPSTKPDQAQRRCSGSGPERPGTGKLDTGWKGAKRGRTSEQRSRTHGRP